MPPRRENFGCCADAVSAGGGVTGCRRSECVDGTACFDDLDDLGEAELPDVAGCADAAASDSGGSAESAEPPDGAADSALANFDAGVSDVADVPFL